MKPQSRTLSQLLREQADSHPDHVALADLAGPLTYAELRDRAISVASALHREGVRPGDRIGLLASNRREWVETFFGAALLGAPVCAFNTWVKSHDLDYLLGHSRVSVLVTLPRFGRGDFLEYLQELAPEMWDGKPGEWRSDRYPELHSVIVIGDAVATGATSYRERIDSQRPTGEPPAAAATESQPAVILYTSGSTARPKAVPLVHRGLIENGFNIGERMGLTPADRVWLGSPLFWSYGSANAMMATLTHGATLVIQEQFDVRVAMQRISEHRCTAAYLLPTLTRAIVTDPAFDTAHTASLRTGLTIGSPDDVRLAAEAIGIPEICNVYGSTEVYGNCAVTPHDLPLADRMACQGPPLPGVEIRIVQPESGETLPTGAVGGIEVRGYVTPGYLDAPDQHASAFTDDGFYRTGDLGFLDDRGMLHYTGRATDMIKTSGINVAPAEVEEFLLTHPSVVEVAVVGAPDEERGEIVVAFVVPERGGDLTPEMVQNHCRDGIASYKVPSTVLLVTELPKTDTGKVHRVRLKELAAEGRRPDRVDSGDDA